jgi:solute carrier family 66, member 2
MLKSQSPDGFSTYVSLVLLIANITRVLWFWVQPFQLVILLASILMILCQLILLYIWVSLAKQTKGQEGFWKWRTTLRPYLQCIAIYCSVLGALCLGFGQVALFPEMLGYFSGTIEAMLGMPQFVHNLN